MGFFDDIFGGFFDFNGDGKTTWDEEWIAYKIMQDVEKEFKKEDISYDALLLDDDELDDLMDDLDEELDSSLVHSENEEWRDYAKENGYGINPEDYETEEEYLSAIEDAEYDEIEPITIPINLSFSVEMPALDRLESIKESDYPNKRQYEAACEKVKLEMGLILGLDEKTKEHNIKQCDFILEHNKDCIAANYLSTQFGEFLYTQAVKEHFDLPFDVPDEDEQMITPIDDLFRQIYKADKALIFPVWKWCIDNFMPFMEYSSDNGYNLTRGIIANADFVDDGFINDVAEFMSNNKAFAKIVMKISPGLDNEYGILLTLLLQKNEIDLVVDMFKICITKDIDAAYINGMISGFMEACSNYDELETMELFEKHILPIIKTISNEEVLSNIDSWEEEIQDYYSYCEENCVQYQYVRGNAWRNKYNDADDYDLDVLNYTSEEDFLLDYEEEKYGWRLGYSEQDTYGLNPKNYETEEEFIDAMVLYCEENQIKYENEYQDALRFLATPSVKKTSKEKNLYESEKQIIKDDKTIYTFVGIMFPYATHHYHYLTDDDTITIGDNVVVPVGTDNKETIGKVVSVETHLRISAPFPIEKTKKVIRKYTEANTPLKKFRLISNNLCYGPCPDADEEVEQHLTILSDGRVWFSRYNFGLCDGKYELAEKKQLNIGKDIAVDILAFTKKYFDEKGIVIKCTDVGIWELFLTDENDASYTIDGSVIPDEYTSEISNYIREKLPFDNMFLFDGNM